jgi:hypothetical protein
MKIHDDKRAMLAKACKGKRPKSSFSLLVQFGSGCNTINGHKKHFLGLNHPKKNFDVMEYISNNLLLGNT